MFTLYTFTVSTFAAKTASAKKIAVKINNNRFIFFCFMKQSSAYFTYKTCTYVEGIELVIDLGLIKVKLTFLFSDFFITVLVFFTQEV
ncbi:hypothetical protein D3C85_1577350 [compost metagenome]